MLVKLTSVKVLDNKMKRQIFGGDCTDQCKDDCANDAQIQASAGGDASGKKLGILPPVL